jgi:DNA polymerase-3 subunit gamma/tau
MDQLIAGAGPEGVTYGRAVALLGVTDAALLDEMCDALAAGDGATAFATIDRVVEAGHDPRRFAGDLLERLRDLIVMQQVPEAAAKGLLGSAEDELDRMAIQADQFGPATLSRMADIVHTGLVDMRGTTAPRLVLELITARMLLPGADAEGALLQRLERMERRLTLSGGEAPSATAGPAPAETAVPATAALPSSPPADVAPAGRPERSAPKAAASAPAPKAAASAPAPEEVAEAKAPSAPRTGAIDAAAVRRIWDEVLTIVRRKSPRAAAVVREATVRDVDGDVLVLSFRHQFHAQALATAPEVLQDAVHEVLGGVWQVRCEVSGQAGAVAPARATEPGRVETTGPANDTAAGRSTTRRAPGGTTNGSSRATTSGRAGPSNQGGRASRGGGAKTSEPSASEDGSAGDDDDWPTPAALGGSAATDVTNSNNGFDDAPSAPSRAGRQTRAAGRTGADRAVVSQRAAPATQARGDDAWADTGEPPFDPEYDGRTPSAGHIGFDPGDEPDDEADASAVRQTSEQQALDLLRQTLGAEKIGEVESR